MPNMQVELLCIFDSDTVRQSVPSRRGRFLLQPEVKIQSSPRHAGLFQDCVVNPLAGLIFLDFESSRTLQLIGRPEILWEVDDPHSESGGTNRYWQFHVDRWLEITYAHQLKWSFLDYSPYNPPVRNSSEA